MSRYIDADKLRKDEIARCHCVPCVGSNDSNYKDLDEVLNDAPTADVVEVRHGHWIEHPQLDFEGGYSGANYECSNCHYADLYDLDDAKYCYCPNCGAKMDGERRD